MLIHGIINAKNKHDFPDIKDVLFGTFCRFVSISKSEDGNNYNIVKSDGNLCDMFDSG